MGKEAYYFSHDANARHDDKILELRAEFGWEGYGLYWAIVETLRDCSDYSFPSNAKAGLALSLNIDKTKLEQFLKRTIDLGLFIEESGVFYSESLMRRMAEIDEKRRRRAEAGRLGGKAKARAEQSSSNAKAKSSKEKESKQEDNSGKYQAKACESWFLNKFNELTGKEHRVLPPKVKTALKTRITKDGYTSAMFIQAIQNCMADEYHRETGLKHLTPEFITRPDKLEKYLQKGSEQATAAKPKTLSTLKEQEEYFGGV